MIRRAMIDDAYIVAELAAKMWDSTAEELYNEFEELLTEDDCVVFLEIIESKVVGFAQCQLRYDYVEGTSTSPVGYLEGVFVEEQYRLQGCAKELVMACEKWAKGKGCMEFASDCELDNAQSLAFHLRSGFTEVNRIVCFTKQI